jgi:hypothetical protein
MGGKSGNQYWNLWYQHKWNIGNELSDMGAILEST